MNDTQNGRVTTRDLLHAVEGSEERITRRIEHLDEKVEHTSKRLTALETKEAISLARSNGILSALAGIKSTVLVTVAVASLVVGILTANLTGI